MISASCSLVVTTPTFSEVSTTPFTSSLMRITPLGVPLSSATKRLWLSAVNACKAVVAGSSRTVMFFSLADSSFCSVARNCWLRVFSASALAAGTATTAEASRGMALRSVPPFSSSRRRFSSGVWANRKRASSLLALPRP
ncbi:hypothetical protein D3C76_1314150 [compost metagenome]